MASLDRLGGGCDKPVARMRRLRRSPAYISVLMTTMAVALGGCGSSDGPSAPSGGRSTHTVSERASDLPAGDFSVCVFAYGESTPQILVGPCSISPQAAHHKGLNVPYVDENLTDGTELSRAYEGKPVRRQLVTDAAKATSIRQRERELAAACAKDVDGCFVR